MKEDLLHSVWVALAVEAVAVTVLFIGIMGWAVVFA
jgi:hypothetical protein